MRDKMPRCYVMHTAFKGSLQVALTVPQRYGTVKVRWVAYPQIINLNIHAPGNSWVAWRDDRAEQVALPAPPEG